MSDIMLSKVCHRCHQNKPYTEFYKRRLSEGMQHVLPGHYVSECKTCMKERSAQSANIPVEVPRAETEKLAITALRRAGHHALPGKAISAAHVDVVVWGAVWIEVKYSRLTYQRGRRKFIFSASPAQQERGFLAHLVMLICDYDDHTTYHLFPADFPAFYKDGRLKIGFTFTPGDYAPRKHGNNRTVMVQGMMNEAENRWELIGYQMRKISGELAQEYRK